MGKNNTCTAAIFVLVSLLTIVFTMLKFVGVLPWGWEWVLSPLWIYASGIWVTVAVVLFLDIIDF